jgi:hypothetical protein
MTSIHTPLLAGLLMAAITACAAQTNTLAGKLMMGYQGWFACAGDGSPVNGWVHWFRNNTPTAPNLTVEMWPDMRELDADELFATSLTYSNGAPAKLYSAYTQKTTSAARSADCAIRSRRMSWSAPKPMGAPSPSCTTSRATPSPRSLAR